MVRLLTNWLVKVFEKFTNGLPLSSQQTTYEWLVPKNYLNMNGVYCNETKLLFSVSQGSINDPILFNAYSSTIPEYIPAGVGLNRTRFGDDYSLQTVIDPIPERINVIENRFYFAMDYIKD